MPVCLLHSARAERSTLERPNGTGVLVLGRWPESDPVNRVDRDSLANQLRTGFEMEVFADGQHKLIQINVEIVSIVSRSRCLKFALSYQQIVDGMNFCPMVSHARTALPADAYRPACC